MSSFRRLRGIRGVCGFATTLLLVVGSHLAGQGRAGADAAGEADLFPGRTAGRSGAVPPDPEEYRIRAVSSEIVVDGRLREPAWASVPPVELPYEWLPGDNTPAPVRTSCRIAFDPQALYVGCEAFDPEPSQVRAHLSDRDDIPNFVRDDHLILLFDTFHDRRRAFQFRVNPLGVQMDGLFSESQGFEDFSWDAIWSSDGRITEEGWVVEVAIPFKSLSVPPGNGEQTWGFMLERSYPRVVRHRISNVPIDRDNSCRLCQAARLEGIGGIETGGDVELIPTLTSRRTDRREGPAAPDLETGEIEVDPGLDLRWRITPNLALNATANPDFSQVEADAAQLEVNRRFAVFFPEKRPFFLEGADLFQTPTNLVFTRTVVDPIGGLKLTGKAGPHALAGFAARDELNRLLFPSNQSSTSLLLEQDVTAGVLRYARDLGGASSVGMLVTDREAEGYHNRLGSVDAFLRLSPANTLQLQAAYSDTEYPDAVAEAFGQPDGAFGGHALSAAFRHASRNWIGSLSIQDAAPEFRADAGFIPRVDIRGGSASLSRVFWGGADRWFSRIAVGVSGELLEDHEGVLTDRNLGASLVYRGPLQSTLTLGTNLERTFFAGDHFDLVRHDLSAALRPGGDIALELSASAGDGIDFASAREGDLLRIVPAADLRIGRPVEMSLSHAFERLTVGGARAFTANLSELRLLYHLGVRAYLRAIVQYRDREVDPALNRGAPPETEALFAQLLFSYKVNPQTVLFAGYSDDRAGLTRRDRTEVDLTQTSRTFFLKLGYAWRP